MRRADRLFQIVQYLRGGRLTTAASLAERLEVSERTIYRDISDLMSTGVPIDGEAGVGYLMREGYDIPPLMFTRDEVAALVAGARMLKAWGGLDMAAAAEEALVKIEAVLPAEARAMAGSAAVHALSWNVPDELRARLDVVQAAVDAPERIAFDYTDEEGRASKRTIRPLGLWFWGKVWTTVGWCELRQDFRMFRVDRMADPVDRLGPFRADAGQRLKDFYAQMQRGRG